MQKDKKKKIRSLMADATVCTFSSALLHVRAFIKCMEIIRILKEVQSSVFIGILIFISIIYFLHVVVSA